MLVYLCSSVKLNDPMVSEIQKIYCYIEHTKYIFQFLIFPKIYSYNLLSKIIPVSNKTTSELECERRRTRTRNCQS